MELVELAARSRAASIPPANDDDDESGALPPLLLPIAEPAALDFGPAATVLAFAPASQIRYQ